MKYLAIFIIEETLYKYSVKGKGVISMSGYFVTNYNPYNVNNKFAFKGVTTDTTSQIKNVPQLTQQPDTVSFSTSDNRCLL